MELRIATCRPLPEPDPDEAPLLAALAERGVRARMAAWHDPAEDWDAPVPTVVRSTWDYVHRVDEFLAWSERAARAAPLWNPLAVVRWNLHKSYLRALAERDFPIVPTAVLARGARTSLAAILAERGWGDVVVKPAVSAASFGTLRAGHGELARGEAHLAALLAERDVLVQRYAPAVETSGERALVWIDGELTHAVRKAPRFTGGDEHVSGALPIAPDERALAEGVLADLAAELLYARVDVVRDEDGGLQLMELELVEPSLFLAQHPPALARLAAALAARLA
jgi:glutathione synthase/RimK-type ligase-like ATP-grasp enzyme